MGYSEGRGLTVEYRWANGDYGRLPSLASDLLGRNPSLIVGAGDPAAQAAKATGTGVPLIFVVGQDPVQSGLVESMSRPGKATGVNFFTGELGGKRLELISSMVPAKVSVGLLLNPRFGIDVADQHQRAVTAAAKSLGRDLIVRHATNDTEIDASFAALVKAGAGALVVQNDPFFDSRRGRIVELSSSNGLPLIAHIREYPADGALMSYGASLSDTYRQVGVYCGKVLRGAQPDDLPVLRPTKFELVVNIRTAKALGLSVPQSILVASDELIE
jgi:putative ABC transport system substrate-binding protein